MAMAMAMASRSAPGTYTGANIRVLEGIEAVRLRPSMYIGDTTVRGLHHLVYEVVDNSIDEAMAGHCRNIHVTIHADGSASIVDDGRGIPVDVHAESGLNTLEVVLTKVHAGGKFDHDTYKVSGGLHGVGVTVVNALSEWLEAEVRREGQVWRQDFRQGVADGPVRATGTAKTTGTKIRFLPDVDDLPQDRLRLRHPGEAAPRAGLPQQGDRDPPDRRAGRRAQGAAVLLVGGAPRVRRLPEPGADGAAPAGGPLGQGRGARRRGRGRLAVQRVDRRDGGLVLQQHPHRRGGHPPDRVPDGPDADPEPATPRRPRRPGTRTWRSPARTSRRG